jgi:RNA polymerase sigma factor (sigma-70 family)
VPATEVPDLVQEALFAAHRALGRFDPGTGSFEAWIGTILVRRARNLARARRRRQVFLDALRLFGLPHPPGSDRTADRVEARLVLDRLLGCLTDTQREVVALYEIGELDAAETARVLDITPAGVRSIARDARLRLAAEAGRGVDATGGAVKRGEERT